MIIGVVVIGLGILPALFLRERFAKAAVDHNPEPDEPRGSLLHSIKDFGRGLVVTLKSTSFLKLGAATFLVFNGFILISSFQYYVIIYYVFGGDQEAGAKWAG